MAKKLIRKSEHEIWADAEFHKRYERISVKLSDEGVFRYFTFYKKKAGFGAAGSVSQKDGSDATAGSEKAKGRRAGIIVKATVVVLKTSPETVLDDYRRLLHMAEYEGLIDKNKDTIIKLNLSWTKYFPSCSSQPWQLEGVVRTLLEDGFTRAASFPSGEQDRCY